VADTIPDHDDSMIFSRRNTMQQGATAAMVSQSVASVLMTTDAALADIYDDKEKERELKAKEDAEDARNLVVPLFFLAEPPYPCLFFTKPYPAREKVVLTTGTAVQNKVCKLQ
jgi:hypothetical protein